MAKKSFDPTAQEAEVVQDTTNTTTALATRPSRELATPVYYSDEEFQGELPEETGRPFLSIVAKTGRMSDRFTPGDFLLNNEYVIGGTKSPLEVVPVIASHAYQNDLPKNEDDDFGDIVDTMSDVIQRGGEKGYRPFNDKTSTHYWKPIVRVVFLIKKPENITSEAAMMFPYTIDGVNYVYASYTARNKSAYGNKFNLSIGLALMDAVKKAKARNGSIREIVYRLSTIGDSYEDVTGETRSWIQPSLKAIGHTSETLREFIKNNPA
jgi:hypothetical protein